MTMYGKRQTAKFTRAVAVARAAGLDVDFRGDNERIYSALQAAGYWWDGESWLYNSVVAAPPMSDVLVRVWAASDVVGGVASDVVLALQSAGYVVVEVSPPYQCRPPKQAESRVYLRLRRAGE